MPPLCPTEDAVENTADNGLLLSEQEYRYDLLGFDLIDRETGDAVEFTAFSRDEIDMPGYVERIESAYTGTQWRPVRVWRTHHHPHNLASVATLLAGLDATASVPLEVDRIRALVHGTQPLLHELLTGPKPARSKQVGHDLMQVYAAILLRVDEHAMTRPDDRHLLNIVRRLLRL